MTRGKQEQVTLSPYNFKILKGFIKTHGGTKSGTINDIFSVGVKQFSEKQLDKYIKAAEEK